MFERTNAIPNLAVRDLAIARRFYGETLGLAETESEGDDFVSYRSGDSDLLVYKSDYAGTNQAPAVTWQVDDVDSTVRELQAKGVRFEHYDLPDTKQEGDVHVGHGMRVAWFKDPDGNILNIASKPETGRG